MKRGSAQRKWKNAEGDSPKEANIGKQCNMYREQEGNAIDYTSVDPKSFCKHRVRLQGPNLGSQNQGNRPAGIQQNAVGCARVRTFILDGATALPHSRQRADKAIGKAKAYCGQPFSFQGKNQLLWEQRPTKSEQRADAWRTKSGCMAERRRADRGKPTPKKTDKGDVANTWWAHGGHTHHPKRGHKWARGGYGRRGGQ